MVLKSQSLLSACYLIVIIINVRFCPPYPLGCRVGCQQFSRSAELPGYSLGSAPSPTCRAVRSGDCLGCFGAVSQMGCSAVFSTHRFV